MKSPRRSIFWDAPGRRRDWLRFTVPYVLVLFGVLYFAFSCHIVFSALPPLCRVMVLVIGVGYSLVPTMYWWYQSWRFEEWIVDAELDPTQIEFEKERFKTNREMAKSFWAAIIAVFGAYVITVK
jgi:hypothetical protein